LIKPDLGTKRICPSCGVRFYDLQKRPIECPKCSFAFEPEMLLKQRRTRVPEPVEKAEKPVAAAAEDDETEDAGESEAENEAEEEAETEEAEVEEAPIEAASEDDEEPDVPAPEEPVVTEDDFEDELEDEDEEDDNLLEEVEEDEDDVTGIIDADIEKDER
jgi:uncharacterized protein (TIGR02300 family)